MKSSTPEFFVEVDAVEGLCPAGERHAEESMAAGKIPVFSCEGPCIRGEIARLAANLVASEAPGMARACHAETFFVPHSGMARWVKEALPDMGFQELNYYSEFRLRGKSFIEQLASKLK